MSFNVYFLKHLIGKVLKKPATMLGISPVSEHVITSSISAADELKAPLIFVVSLNQVDVDGGYTGFTPTGFVEHVRDLLTRNNFRSCPIFQVDHCGPWLKDKHIAENYSYNEALDATLKSAEAFIKAGFNLFHIDTTIDLERREGIADIKTAAKRTAQLIEMVESMAKNIDHVTIYYEIGSDRWGYKSPEIFCEFISLVIIELKKRKIDPEKILFAVADVGTRIIPGNRVNEKKVLEFSKVVQQYNYSLKIHSGDYLENPDVLPRCNVGGVNIGPMFAEIQYRCVKSAILKIMKYDVLEELNALIRRSDKLGKYSKKEKVEEYELGLASRYIWSKKEALEIIKTLESHGIPITDIIQREMKTTIKYYLKELNLAGLLVEEHS